MDSIVSFEEVSRVESGACGTGVAFSLIPDAEIQSLKTQASQLSYMQNGLGTARWRSKP